MAEYVGDILKIAEDAIKELAVQGEGGYAVDIATATAKAKGMLEIATDLGRSDLVENCFLGFLKRPNIPGSVKEVALKSLWKLQHKEIDQLAGKHITDEDPEVREISIEILKEKKPQFALDKIRQALDDVNPKVQVAAADALLIIGDKDTDIKRMLKHNNPKILDVAMTHVGEKNLQLTKELIPLITHADTGIRIKAVQTLGKIGDKGDKECIKSLKSAAKNEAENIEVRTLAMSTLSERFGDSSIAEELRNDKNPDIKNNARYILLVSGKPEKAIEVALADLEELQKGPDRKVSLRIKDAMEKFLPSKNDVKLLCEIIEGKYKNLDPIVPNKATEKIVELLPKLEKNLDTLEIYSNAIINPAYKIEVSATALKQLNDLSMGKPLKEDATYLLLSALYDLKQKDQVRYKDVISALKEKEKISMKR